MSQQDSSSPPSGWAIGGITFAVVMMAMIGLFQIIAGLVAIIDDDFYVVTQNYTFDIDTSAWGWIHLLLGILLVLAGYGLYSGATWGAARRDRDGGPDRGGELLLHPVLPVLVDPRDRALRLGDLGTDPTRRDRSDRTSRTRAHRSAGRGPRRAPQRLLATAAPSRPAVAPPA